MKDIATRASVGAQNMARSAAHRLRALQRNERGTVVETVIITALVVIAAVVLGGILIKAVTNQGNKISGCIEGVNKGSCTSFK